MGDRHALCRPGHHQPRRGAHPLLHQVRPRHGRCGRPAVHRAARHRLVRQAALGPDLGPGAALRLPPQVLVRAHGVPGALVLGADRLARLGRRARADRLPAHLQSRLRHLRLRRRGLRRADGDRRPPPRTGRRLRELPVDRVRRGARGIGAARRLAAAESGGRRDRALADLPAHRHPAAGHCRRRPAQHRRAQGPAVGAAARRCEAPTICAAAAPPPSQGSATGPRAFAPFARATGRSGCSRCSFSFGTSAPRSATSSAAI